LTGRVGEGKFRLVLKLLLKANRKGQWAIDVEHPYRLIFDPANDPLPYVKEDILDLSQITAIRLLEIEDYHD